MQKVPEVTTREPVLLPEPYKQIYQFRQGMMALLLTKIPPVSFHTDTNALFRWLGYISFIFFFLFATADRVSQGVLGNYLDVKLMTSGKIHLKGLPEILNSNFNKSRQFLGFVTKDRLTTNLILQ